MPRTEEKDDGLHWIVDGADQGMWNGVGPGFTKYQKGSFAHVDEMKDSGSSGIIAGAPSRGRPPCLAGQGP